MIDERRAFVIRFRELADKFSEKPDQLEKFQLLGEAGALLMAAYDRGYVVLPGLGELVDLTRTPTTIADVEEGTRAARFCHPSILFREVAGYDNWRIAPDDKGQMELTGEAAGGLLPDLLKESPAVPRPQKGQPLQARNNAKFSQFAFTCRLLADDIERWNPCEARDAPIETPNDERDKWLYEQCCELVGYNTIVTRLRKLAKKKNWELIESVQGVKEAARRYAKRHNLTAIPKRQSGRSPKEK